MGVDGTGFGEDRFGAHPFGQSDWSRRVLWDSIPQYDRDLDLTEGGGALESLFSVIGDMLNPIRDLARDMTWSFDPLLARSADDGATSAVDSLLFVPSSLAEDGRSYVIASLVEPETASRIDASWLVVVGGSSYTIRDIRKSDGEVDFYAESEPVGSDLYFEPVSMLSLLGSNMGVLVDGHEPVHLQRGSITDNPVLLDIKGTKRGIEVRAEMAGFSAVVSPLFRIGSAPADDFESEDVFQVPDGSGKWYTKTAPRSPSFDFMKADVSPLDSPEGPSIAGEITEVSGAAGAWQVYLGTDPEHVDSAHWYMTVDADPLQQRYFVDGSRSAEIVVVISKSPPPLGAVTWRVATQVSTRHGYVASHKVRVELDVIDETLKSAPERLEGAFNRMVQKIEKMLPIHVEVAQYVFSTSYEATVGLAGEALSETLTFDAFDEVGGEADVKPLDGYEITTH